MVDYHPNVVARFRMMFAPVQRCVYNMRRFVAWALQATPLRLPRCVHQHGCTFADNRRTRATVKVAPTIVPPHTNDTIATQCSEDGLWWSASEITARE